MKAQFEIDEQEVASVYAPGDQALAIDVDGYSRMSPEQARALAKWLNEAADLVEKEGK